MRRRLMIPYSPESNCRKRVDIRTQFSRSKWRARRFRPYHTAQLKQSSRPSKPSHDSIAFRSVRLRVTSRNDRTNWTRLRLPQKSSLDSWWAACHRTLHIPHQVPEKRYLRSSQYCRNLESSVAGLLTDTRNPCQQFYDTPGGGNRTSGGPGRVSPTLGLDGISNFLHYPNILAVSLSQYYES